MDENNFFVAIKESNVFRKSLLGGSKQILLVLKHNQKIQVLRDKKLRLIESLKEQVKELIMLLSKLESKMPPHEIFHDLKLEGFDIGPKKKAKKEELKPDTDALIKASREMKDLDKLESALDDIEKKLNKLK